MRVGSLYYARWADSTIILRSRPFVRLPQGVNHFAPHEIREYNIGANGWSSQREPTRRRKVAAAFHRGCARSAQRIY